MISLQKILPLIQNGQGVAVAFQNDWLRAALERAARLAGYDRWELLDDLSATIAQYLRQDECAVIELPRLERVVRTALRDIGFHEIASRFRATNPFQAMSLLECCRDSDARSATQCFRRLSVRIHSLHAAKVQQFHFYDLQPCVERLVAAEGEATWWSHSLTQERIVTFIRERVQALPWTWKVHCSIR